MKRLQTYFLQRKQTKSSKEYFRATAKEIGGLQQLHEQKKAEAGKDGNNVLIYKICRESEIQTEQEKQRQAANMYRPKITLCSGKMWEMHGMQETEAAGMGHTAFGRSP